MPDRHYYLEDLPLDEAHARFAAALAAAGWTAPLPGQHVPLTVALGRVTAAPVRAALSSPAYHAAAMDGIAVRAAGTEGAAETHPLRLTPETQFRWIDTGDPLPPEFDAVIMAEQVQPLEGGSVEIRAAVAPWQHVRPLGEDMVATEVLLPENHRIRPVDLGALAAAGVTQVAVRRTPQVAILPTGSELVETGKPVPRGGIIDSNSLMLAALVQEWRGEPARVAPLPDVKERLREALEWLLPDHDIVVVNAGSSAGSEDFTAPVIAELGTVAVHGVAIRPGHPVILGVVQGKPVLGIPGYPVSAALTAEIFLKPLLARLEGLPVDERPTVEATLSRKVLSPAGEDEFLRVTLGQVGNRLVAAPLARGAGVTMSLVRADGIARIPRFSEGVHAGGAVTVELLRSPGEIARTIVAVGSHDLALDLLGSFLRRLAPPLRLSSANVGSLGGLIALKRGEAHLAGTHLLDEESGVYNLPYLRRLIPELDPVLVHLADRQQGLIVPPGNPLGVTRLEDLLRPDVRFVNRQRGAGTRVLLDYRLRQEGLTPEAIRGYEREEYTHMAVAAAVEGGTADAGLGILAAARALGLDFVPLLKEPYDLAIPRRYFESSLVQAMLSALRTEEFRAAVEALGGYDVAGMGEVIAT